MSSSTPPSSPPALASLKDVCILGALLPPALQAAMSSSATMRCRLSGVVVVGKADTPPALASSSSHSPPIAADQQQRSLSVSDDAVLVVDDVDGGRRWTARVASLAARGNDCIGDSGGDGVLSAAAAQSVDLALTLVLDASSWQSSALPPPAAPNASQTHTEEQQQHPAKQARLPAPSPPPPLQTSSKPPPPAAAAALPSTSPTPSTNDTAGPAPAPAPASAAAAVGGGGGKVQPQWSRVSDFHFYEDQSLAKAERHIGAATMSLRAILENASPSSSSSTEGGSVFSPALQQWIEPLLLDIAHALAPANRPLRDLLAFIFGGASDAPSSPAAVPYHGFTYASARTASSSSPRCETYRDVFSLSDVHHLSKLLCAYQSSSSAPLVLAALGHALVDMGNLPTVQEKRKVSDRAFPLLVAALAYRRSSSSNASSPLPLSLRTMGGHDDDDLTLLMYDTHDGSNSKNKSKKKKKEEKRVASVSASALVRRNFTEAALEARLQAMEPFVDRDVVIAHKAGGSGVMSGLGAKKKAATASAASEDPSSPTANAGSAGEQKEEGQHAAKGKRQSGGGAATTTTTAAATAATAQYHTLLDVRIPWKEGDLSGLLEDNKPPADIAAVLDRRQKQQKQRRRDDDADDMDATADAQSRAEEAEGGDGQPARRRARREDGKPSLPSSSSSSSSSLCCALPRLSVTTPEEYAAGRVDYERLVAFVDDTTARLEAFARVRHAKDAWLSRTPADRRAPSLDAELDGYFSRNGARAEAVAAVVAAVRREAHQLERELRAFAGMWHLGIIH